MRRGGRCSIATLVDAAVDSGVEVRYGVRIDDVKRDDRGRVCGVVAIEGGTTTDRCRPRHRCRRFAFDHRGASQCRLLVEGRQAAGVLYSYWENVPVDGYYWCFQRGASIGAIPTNDGATCVFASVPSAGFRSLVQGAAGRAYRRVIREVSPAFDARLAAGRQVEPVRGFGGHVGFIKRGSGPGWALVGDAGYFKDPITAHGITDALRDAELLARAIVKGTSSAMEEYETVRHDLSRRLFEVTDQIASYTWTDTELQALHRAFSSEMSREVRALAALEPFPYATPVLAHLGRAEGRTAAASCG